MPATASAKKTSGDDKYTLLCVWPQCSLGDSSVEDLVKFFLDQLNTRIIFAEEVITEPDRDQYGKTVPETGGRPDLFFWVHDEDISRFAIQRLQFGIRWWEDIVGNKAHRIYPKKVLASYMEK